LVAYLFLDVSYHVFSLRITAFLGIKLIAVSFKSTFAVEAVRKAVQMAAWPSRLAPIACEMPATSAADG